MTGPEPVRPEPPELEPAFAQAHDWPAFSNGYEGERWQGAWCGTCVHGGGGEGCALMDVAILGRTPRQWELREPGGLVARYDCTVYRPECADHDVRGYVNRIVEMKRQN